VSARSGVKFTIHDLRRTFITIAESLGISPYALKRLLNHRIDADVTAGYIVIDAERLRQPVEQIAERILELAYAEGKKVAA
jgi:integrase